MKFKTGICFSVFFSLHLLALTQLPAQSIPPLREEVEILEDDNPYSVFPMGDLGLLLVMNQNDLMSREAVRRIIFYDENLSKRWDAFIPLPYYYQFLSVNRVGDSLEFILSALSERKVADNFARLQISLRDASYTIGYFKADWPSKAEPQSLSIFKDHWLFLVKEKSLYYWYGYYPKEEKLEVHPLTDNKGLQWIHLLSDTVAGKVYTVFRDENLKKTQLFLYAHDQYGNLEYKKELKPDGEGLRLIDAKLALLPDGNILMLGSVHVEREKQQQSIYDRGTETMGLFSFVLENESGEKRQIWYKEFLDFPHLDTLISLDTKYFLQQAKQRAKGRKIIPSFVSQLRVLEAGDRIGLLAEIYDRKVTTTTETYYDHYGRMVPYTRTYFDGFQFKDAFLVQFDTTGNPVDYWVMDIHQDRLVQELKSFTQVLQDEQGRLLYAFHLGNAVYYRSIDEKLYPSEVMSVSLPSLYSGDRVLKTWNEGLLHWFDDKFVSFGGQQILNNQYKGKSKRNVFYLQRFQLDR